MYITNGQKEFYEKNGYLVLPDLISQKEISVLMQDINKLSEEESEQVILEKSGAIRSIFAAHNRSKYMDNLIRLPQLLETAKALLESDVYLHQFKINAKVALEGEQWEWHQDYLYWHKEDAMPTARVLTVAVFLNDVNEFNGPMLVIPRSHFEGMIDVSEQKKIAANEEPVWMSTLTADLKYKITPEILGKLLKKSEIKSIQGKAGFALIFHGNMFHASSQNLSCTPRQCIFVSYNSVENKLQEIENPRPNFIANRDFTPLTSVSENALLEFSAV